MGRKYEAIETSYLRQVWQADGSVHLWIWEVLTWVGVERPKFKENIGSLWRTADLLGVDCIFTIGQRYQRQPTDTMASERNVSLTTFAAVGDLLRCMSPLGMRLIGVERSDGATPLHLFQHPAQACYLLGSEDHGLSAEALKACRELVRLPGRYSMNVACAGSIVLWDRSVRC